MTEWRRHPRVKESIAVRWSNGFWGTQGNGVIRNISISGILLEVDDRFSVVDQGQYLIDAISSDHDFVPRETRLVWCNRIKTDQWRRFCGMKFINAEGPIRTRLAEHIQMKRSTYFEAMDINIMSNYLSQSN